ncbi:MAG: peptidase S41, partial [Prevotella sp.]
MKKLLFLTAALLSAVGIMADNSPLWMRYPAISPDGQTIAFTYCGDIYTVPVTGGRAMQLTTNSAYDTRPVWSPDGRQIAFASDRNGGFDVFVMSSEGGQPKQITTHSANEYPEIFTDNEHVLYSAFIQPAVNDIQFPAGMFAQIYQTSIQGGRPVMYSSLAMQSLSLNKKGDKLLYQDLKGYEDPWRKHHKSSITRDVWMCSLGQNRTYKKLTSFKGEDRNPVWAADDNSYYYLSEESGSFNIYRRNIDGGTPRQITHHTDNPVRFLTSSADGLLCYGYDGEIYTVREGGEPRKVDVNIVTDRTESPLVHRLMSSGATSIDVSPDGKEVAFVLRGDVYVTSAEYETTRRITDTPQQERDVTFSPDGRSIAYSAERGATWGIYQSTIVRKDDKLFT